MIQYFENFYSQSLLKDLQSEVFSTSFQWNYHDVTSGGPGEGVSWLEDKNTEDSSQLVSVILENSKIFPLITPLIYKIKDIVGCQIYLDRVKVNLMLPLPNRKYKLSYNRPHVDHQNANSKTLIYYLNDSDGETVLFDKTFTGSKIEELSVIERVTPKENLAILFDSNRYHASSNPTFGKRSVINFIFWEDTKVDQFKFPPIEETVRKIYDR